MSSLATDTLTPPLRLALFGQEEALRMIREVKGYALLESLRGAPRCDINPFLVLPAGQGAVALDALIVKRLEK